MTVVKIVKVTERDESKVIPAEAAREADSAREIGGVCWRFFYSVFHSHFHALLKRRAGKNDIAF